MINDGFYYAAESEWYLLKSKSLRDSQSASHGLWAMVTSGICISDFFITFVSSFGGAYDIENITIASTGDCQAPHVAVDGRG